MPEATREAEEGGGCHQKVGREYLVGLLWPGHLLIAGSCEEHCRHGPSAARLTAGDGHGDGHVDPGAVQSLVTVPCSRVCWVRAEWR